LLNDVDEMLAGFGIDLKQPMERMIEALLDWARQVFENAIETWIAAERAQSHTDPKHQSPVGEDRPRPAGPGQHAREKEARRPKATTSRASGKAVEEELAAIKQRVRAGFRSRHPATGNSASVEAELRTIKSKKGKNR